MIPKKEDQTDQKNQPLKNGSDAIIASLVNQGVEYVFGMTGGAIMPVYDAMFRSGAPRHIIAGHEQGAAHMAEGYARVTGRPGVVFTTSGPGATNLVTGLADAMMDSTPMVAITGQVSSNLLGNDAFQEADMWGITMPVTKHNYQVGSVEELPDIIAEAFYVAMSGRPGPVLIDLPRDVAVAPAENLVSEPSVPTGYSTAYKVNQESLKTALDLIKTSNRPVILAGGGVIQAEASKELRGLAETLEIPVATTLMGLGGFPSGHKLHLGMPGMHGSGYANLAIHNSDVIICVGCRLDDRVTGKVSAFAPGAKLIHIDVDASELGKILPCAVGLEADAKPALKALAKGAAGWDRRPDFTAWHQQIDRWREKHPMGYVRHPKNIMPQTVIEAMGKKFGSDTVVVTGVGQHQMFTAQYYPFKEPRTLVTSGGLGTMGYGLPAALGAKLGRPDKDVVLVDGDGSFLMNIQELATAVRYRIGLVAVVLNNSYLGMVRQWQDLFLDGRRSQTQLHTPPYSQVAAAFGGLGKQVLKEEEIEPALDWALKECRSRSLPVVVEIKVDPDENVLPMVPAGGANPDFIPCKVEDRK